MTNTQLLLAIAGLIVTVIATQMAAMKWYVDARFNAIDARFNGVDARFNSGDGQLKFLVDHAVSHAERIARLEVQRQ